MSINIPKQAEATYNKRASGGRTEWFQLELWGMTEIEKRQTWGIIPNIQRI
ncbi:hypothetical protein ABGV42_22935 [Paenibacillus pabuli]